MGCRYGRGFFGGALTGGLEGGWQGALFGGLIGGALGGLGGWGLGIAQAHKMTGQFIAGSLIAGAGAAGATDSWDSFLGGLTGGIAGSLVGSGFVNSEQFKNWKAGNGFVSNRTARTNEYLQKNQALRVESQKRGDFVEKKVYGRRLQTNDGGLRSRGPRHLAAEGPWEMGPRGGIGSDKGNIVTSDTVGDLSTWETHLGTQEAISSGQVLEGTTNVSEWGWAESGKLYNEYWVGQPYMAPNRNSNFAIDSRIYGAGGDLPDGLGWHPEFR